MIRRVQLATSTGEELDAIGRLLHDFNAEYGEDTPGPQVLAARIAELLGDGDTEVVVAGDPPEGLAVLRLRKSIWTPHLECYLAELYVVPDRRGKGTGRAIMEVAIALARERGADWMDLGTASSDIPARRLYERLGFDNHEGGPGGPVQLVYERQL